MKEFYWNTAGEIEARDTAARRRMSAEERKNTPPKLGDADTVFADGNTTSFSIEGEDGTYEALHGKDGTYTVQRLADGKTGDPRGNIYKLANSISELAKMAPVANLDGTELNDRSKTASQQIREFFDEIGNRVEREGYGEVALDDYGAKASSTKDHHPTRAKIMAVAAIPEVIRYGKQISYTNDHRGTPSYIFAAPVNMMGKTAYVAAVVNEVTRTENGRAVRKYYLNEIVDAEGFRFNVKKENPDTTKADRSTGGRGSGGSEFSSDTSIRSTTGNSQEKSSGKASVEVSGINNRTAAELNDGKRRRRTVGNTKRDIMQLFSTDRANRTDVERVLNRNIGEMMAQGEIRGDALDTLVNELLQTGSVVSSSKNSPWIDQTYESIRNDLKGGKLYVSKDMCYELDAAEHYAKHALRNKDEDKELGDVYERVARQELDHCEMFHAQAVRLIREHGEAPSEAMRAVWEYEHDKIMERDAEIRVKLGLYDGR